MSINNPENGLPTVQRFHQELKAAACAGVPLELAASDSWFSRGTVTFRKLDAIAVLIADRLARGQTLQQLTGKFDEIPSRYLAALRLYDQTGEMGLVLDGLATSALSRRQLASMFRGTIIYLLIVIMVAAIGLEFFANFIVPSIETMREGMQLFSTAAPKRVEGAELPRTVVTVLKYLAWAMVLFLIFGGSAKIVALFGGRRYRRLRAAATAMRSIGVLVSHGVAVSEAASISCDLVGAGAADRRQLVSAVQGCTAAAVSEGYLQRLSEHFQSLAENRRAAIRVILPVTLFTVIGGASVLTYSLAIFWPVINLLHELALPGA